MKSMMPTHGRKPPQTEREAVQIAMAPRTTRTMQRQRQRAETETARTKTPKLTSTTGQNIQATVRAMMPTYGTRWLRTDAAQNVMEPRTAAREKKKKKKKTKTRKRKKK